MTRIPTRSWFLATALSLAAALLATTVPFAAEAVPTERGKPTPSPIEAKIASCSRPALTPGLRIADERRRAPAKNARSKGARARDVAALAHRLGVPARGQALAVTAVLSGDLSGRARQRAFFAKLDAVKGWEALPPSIAIHRVLRTPDPFAYEADWTRAVVLLASFAAELDGSAEQAVSVGGRAPRACRASAADASALPLPAGSSYRVQRVLENGTVTPGTSTTPSPATSATSTQPPESGPKAAARKKLLPAEVVEPEGQETQFLAPCGTPVLAATAGTVELVSDDTAAGPWLIRVRSGARDVITEYAHVQNPVVAGGSTVLVGQQVAEVGDLGNVASCALGLTITANVDSTPVRVDPVRWLTSQIEAPEPIREIVPETRFRVAAYNVLGHHLTAPGGGRPGFAPGTTRVANGLARMEAVGVSIVVLNEFESPQADVISGDGEWGLHRATPNNVFRTGSTNGNAVAWRLDTWKMIANDEFTVPWQVTLHMPVVYLQHRVTGAIVTVIGIHNPASTARAGNQQGARVLARDIELDFITRHREMYPDVPVILAGDFNERETAFCGLTGTGLLAASAGGSVGGPCYVPRHGPVDWIFGTTDLNFLGQSIDKSFLRVISDHPLLS
ncbi:MAG: peptidoglycan DD-metalloendopeptidase family protein, partial [Nocardioides sp.]